jgi:hypothetical protein
MDCVLVSSAVDHVYYIIKNNISDVMDCVLVSSAVDHVFEPQNQDKISEWSDMSTHGLMFQ